MISSNPLQQPLQILFQRLVTLTGLAHIVEDYLEGYRRFFISQFAQHGIDNATAFAGFNLIVWDIVPEPGHEPGHWRPVSSFSAAGDHYFDLADHFVQREAAWTISQTYETFETYLKDLLCACLAVNATDASLIPLRPPREPSDPASWRALPSVARLSSTRLLELLRTIEPSMAAAERTNQRKMNVAEWHLVLGEVRHAATHSDFRIRAARTSAWPPARLRILRRKFPGHPDASDYVLRLSRDDAASAVQMAADYAFLLFKCLSRARGYDWDILAPPQEGPAA